MSFSDWAKNNKSLIESFQSSNDANQWRSVTSAPSTSDPGAAPKKTANTAAVKTLREHAESLSSKKKKKKKQVSTYDPDYQAKMLNYDTQSTTNRLTGLRSQLHSLNADSVGIKAFGAGGTSRMKDTSTRRKELQAEIKRLTGELSEANAVQNEARAYENEERLLKYDVDDAQRRLADMKDKLASGYKAADNVRAFGGSPNLSREQKSLKSQIDSLSAELEQARSVQYYQKGTVALEDLKKSSPIAWDKVNVLASDNAADDTRALGAYSGRANENTDKARMLLKSMGYADKDIEQMVDYRKRQLNRERYEAARRRAQELANQGFGGAVAASLESIPMNMMSGLGTLDIIGQNLRKDDRPIDYYSGGMAISAFSNAARGQVAQNIMDRAGNVDAGKTLSWLYQTGMSLADSAVTMLASSAVGSVAGASSLATKATADLGLLMLGGSASTTTITAAKERGLTDKQALGLGLVAGAAEIITEKVSIDTFLDTVLKGDKNLIISLGKNAIAEGGEEVGSDFINLFADIAISQDKSEWKRSIKDYESLGYDESEAFSLAFADQAKQMGVSFLGGFLSGGVMGTTGAAINSIADKNMRTNVMAATFAEEDSNVYRLGQQIQQRLADEVAGEAESVAEQPSIADLYAQLTSELNNLPSEERKTLINDAKAAMKLEKTESKNQQAEDVAEVEVTEDEQDVEEEPSLPGALDAAVNNPQGITGKATNTQVKAIIADRASVEALGLEYGDGKVLRNMTAAQSRAAVSEALDAFTQQSENVESPVTATAEQQAEVVAEAQELDNSNGKDDNGNDKLLTYEQFAELFKERFDDASDAEIEEAYKDYSGSPSSVAFNGKEYTLREFRSEVKKRNPDMTENQIVELFNALMYEQNQATNEGGEDNGERSEQGTVGNGGGLSGESVQRTGEQGGRVPESGRSGEGAVGERNAPDAERGVQEDAGRGRQEVSGEPEKTGAAVISDAQTNTDEQAGAEAETPSTKPVSFTSGNMDIQYDRAVNAIKNAEEEVKDYASRIKKLGGKFDMAAGNIRYGKSGSKKTSSAAGLTVTVNKGGKVSVIVNAQKAAVAIKHEFVHFLGDTIPGFRARLYQAFADIGEVNEALDNRITQAYAKYEGVYGKFSDKTRVDYYEEFFADLNAGVNRIGMDETRFNAYQKLMQKTIETHESIAVEVLAKQKAAQKKASKSKNGKGKARPWLSADLTWKELLPYIFVRTGVNANEHAAYDMGFTVRDDTPSIYQRVGLADAQITANPDHIYKNMLPVTDAQESDSQHDVPYDVMEKLPQLLENPAMLVRGYDSKNGRRANLMVVTNEINPDKNAPYVVVITPNQPRTVDGRQVKANEVTSVYAKDNLSDIKREEILYWDKGLTDKMVLDTGMELPMLENLDPNFVFGYVSENVKKNNTGLATLQRNNEDRSPRTEQELEKADTKHRDLDRTASRYIAQSNSENTPDKTIGEQYFPAEDILSRVAHGDKKALVEAVREVLKNPVAQENLGITFREGASNTEKMAEIRKVLLPLAEEVKSTKKSPGRVLRDAKSKTTARPMIDEDGIDWNELDDDEIDAALVSTPAGGAPMPGVTHGDYWSNGQKFNFYDKTAIVNYAKTLAEYFGLRSTPGSIRFEADEWADEFSVYTLNLAGTEWVELMTGDVYDYDGEDYGEFVMDMKKSEYVARAEHINRKESAPVPQDYNADYDKQTQSFRFTQDDWADFANALANFVESDASDLSEIAPYVVDKGHPDKPYQVKADRGLVASAIKFNSGKRTSNADPVVTDDLNKISRNYSARGFDKRDVEFDAGIGLYRDRDTGRPVYECDGRFYYNDVPVDLWGVKADLSPDPTDPAVDPTKDKQGVKPGVKRLKTDKNKRSAFADLKPTPTNTPEFERYFNDPTTDKLLTDPKTGGPRNLYTGTGMAGYTYANKQYALSSPRAAVWASSSKNAVLDYAMDGDTKADIDAAGGRYSQVADSLEFRPVNLETWEQAEAFAEYDLGLRLEQNNGDYILYVPDPTAIGNDSPAEVLYRTYPATPAGLDKFNREYGEIMSDVGVKNGGFYRIYGSSQKAVVIDCHGRSWHECAFDPVMNTLVSTDHLVNVAFTKDYDLVIFRNVHDSATVNGSIDDYVFRYSNQVKSVYNNGQWSTDKDHRFMLDEEEKNEQFDEMIARGRQLLNDPNSAYNKANKAKPRKATSIAQNAQDEFDAWLIYSKLGQKYGTIQQTGTNYREANVPSRTSPVNKVSKTASTVMGAEATPEARLGTIAEAIVGDKLSYNPRTDKLAINRARNRIRKVGFNEAQLEWATEVRAGKVSKDLVAMGATLLNNTGNATAASGEQYISIMTDYADLLRNAGQALQAARLLKNMSPEGKLYAAQKRVDKLNEALKEKGFDPTKYPEVQIDKDLVNAYRKAKTEEERNALMEKIAQNIADQIPSTFMDKFTAWRYLAMLGNFRTQVRNVLGNTAMQPMRMLKASVAGVCEAAVNRVSGGKIERTTSALHDMETFRAAFDDYHNVRDIILGGGKFDDSKQFTRDIEERRRIFKSKILEGYRKATNWAMDTGDSIFCSFTYADALSRFMKANNTTWSQASEELKDRGRQVAIREAAEATYRDNNAFSDLILKIGIKRPKNKVEKAGQMFIEGVLPFKKTPANILVRSVEYSPVGLVYSAVSAARKAAGNENITGTDIVNQLSKGLTGTGLLILGFAASAMGMLVGKSPDDDREKEAWEREGHQAYSFEIDGHSYTLDWLAPVSVPMFLGANMQQVFLEDGLSLKEAISALSSISDPVLEMSMLQGIQDLIDNAANYGDDGSLVRLTSNALWGYLTQTVPTLLGQAERASVNERIQTYTDANSEVPTDWQYMLGKLSAKVPGWDYAQTVYTDAWGRVEYNADSETMNVIQQFFSPGYSSQIQTSDMEKELYRLYEATGDASLLITKPPKYISVSGEKVNLTADQYLTYNTTRGQEAYNTLTALTESAAYSRLDDEAKAELVSDVYDYATEIAKGRTLPDYSNSTLEKLQAVMKTGVDLSDYVVLKSRLDENGNGSVSQSEAQAALDSSGLSRVQKSAMWKSINKSWKANPYA